MVVQNEGQCPGKPWGMGKGGVPGTGFVIFTSCLQERNVYSLPGEGGFYPKPDDTSLQDLSSGFFFFGSVYDTLGEGKVLTEACQLRRFCRRRQGSLLFSPHPKAVGLLLLQRLAQNYFGGVDFSSYT
jgi:hypothetical protein